MIPVAVAFTPEYFIPAATMLRSLLDTSSAGYKIICLVTEALPERMLAKLNEMGEGRLQVECVSLKGRLKDIYISPRYTEAASFRLLLPELFPEYDRMYYIDCDIIIRQDIGRLFDEIDLKDNYLACVLEASEDEQINRIQKLGCNPYRYFNSGFLLMNLDQMRKEKVTEQLLNACRVDYLVFPDQDALNIVCKDRIVPLEPKYNAIRTFFIPKYKKTFLKWYSERDWTVVQREGTIHYTGAKVKPWIMFTVQFDKWWLTYEELPLEIRNEWEPPKRVRFYWSIYRYPVFRHGINAVRWLKRQLINKD